MRHLELGTPLSTDTQRRISGAVEYMCTSTYDREDNPFTATEVVAFVDATNIQDAKRRAGYGFGATSIDCVPLSTLVPPM